MKLRSFTAKNIFSFDYLELNLNNQGVTLVNGWNLDKNSHNASGKSSLTSKGIPWVLYGKTINGIKGDEVKRINSEGESWGQISFQGLIGQLYRVTRYRAPSKLELEHFTDKWTDISNRVQSETQEQINQLLGKDFQVFLYTDFFGQGLENTFIRMNSNQQNTLFEFVISLDKVNKLVENSKARRRSIFDKTSELEHQIKAEKDLFCQTGTIKILRLYVL